MPVCNAGGGGHDLLQHRCSGRRLTDRIQSDALTCRGRRREVLTTRSATKTFALPQAHRRRRARRISQRCRRGALRRRNQHGVAERNAGVTRRAPHRVPGRRSSRRRRGGPPDGRWRQYRRPAGGPLRAGRRLSLRAGVLAGRRTTARKRRGLHEPGLLRGGSRRRAIALQRAKRIPSNTAQRTSIRFGSCIWNTQGGLLP